jgi:hypothetical protein
LKKRHPSLLGLRLIPEEKKAAPHFGKVKERIHEKLSKSILRSRWSMDKPSQKLR